jgi:DNA-binding transcriptional ArsR family regulator
LSIINRLASVNQTSPSARTKRRTATPAETKALAHPLRLRIIRLLYDAPLSNKMLATRLDEHPATVLHHVRTLLRTGFVEPAGEQAGARGTVEKLYRSTGKSWELSIDESEGATAVSQAGVAAFVEELRDAPDGDVDMSRLALVVSPERLRELQTRIAEVLDDYALSDEPDGERWAVFVAYHRRA